MEYFYVVLGSLLYVLIVSDIFTTTLSMQGGGWLTTRFSNYFWKIFLRISGKNGHSGFLDYAGFILLITIILIWTGVLWLSFSLLVHSDPGSIINSSTKAPVDITGKIYYTGYIITTLGTGDYIASSNLWRIVSNIYSFTGLLLLTMSVTYFIPVLSAVIEQRHLGIKLSALGSSSEEMILNSWNGKDFSRLTDKIPEISDALIKHSQHHRAYPVIHYFHNSKEKNNIILQLARLYEVLFLLKNSIKTEVRPEPQDLSPLEVAFENYLEVITKTSHFRFDKPVTSPPDYPKLEEAGLLDLTSGFNSLYEADRNRTILQSLVNKDGWDWSHV